MATSTISNTLTDASGNGLAEVEVIVRLVPRGAFRTDTGTEIAPIVRTTTDVNGAWSLVLEEQANITPSNSFYEVEERIPNRYGGPRKHTFEVGASNATLHASLVTPIPDMPTANYLTQTAADARYVLAPGSFGSTPSESRPNDAGSGGVATSYSRSDHTHDREQRYGTAAARAALTGTDLFEALEYRETDGLDKLFVYRAAAWLQKADYFIVADATARNAITNPYEGMRCYLLDSNKVQEYDGTTWVTMGIASTATQTGTHTLSQGASSNIAKTVTESQYRVVNGQCTWWFKIDATAAGTAGSAVNLTFPVIAGTFQPGTTLGAGMVYDGSAVDIFVGVWEQVNASVMQIATEGGTNQGWGGTPSVAVGNGDSFRGCVQFLVSTLE